MSVVDTIKKSVLDNFTGTISAWDMLLSLVIAFTIGMFIIYVYRKTYQKKFSKKQITNFSI